MNNVDKNRVVIGIDQSYKRTGICVKHGEVIRELISIDMSNFKDNSVRRFTIRTELDRLADVCHRRYSHNITCIIERIRCFSKGVMSFDYIKSIGALNAVIIDTLAMHDVPVYSVDTRAWKAAVVGTSKPEKPIDDEYRLVKPEKYPTIRWCVGIGLCDKIRYIDRRKYVAWNDDLADSVAIAHFGFLPGITDKLKLEK